MMTTFLVARVMAAGKLGVPVVILKLDDVTRNGAHGNAPVSPRWQRCVRFLEKERIKASFGIIGSSLEKGVPAYFDWIKDLDRRGIIEFWNHCYSDGPDQLKGKSAGEQKDLLQKTQKLSREKLGITLRAFGPHWGPTNEATEEALAGIPEITIWFYGPKQPKGKQVILERTVNLEQPTFVPNFEKVKAGYARYGHKLPYLAMQGHPNEWTDERWANFVKVVQFLKEQGCPFMTASEYVKSVGGKVPAAK
jgi:peptidoglycan/xylan/chitin deacetylase (PgdA/CDA1 family)